MAGMAARIGGQAGPQTGDRLVAVWLAAVAVLVIAMIVVGGATRLTDSGLSITEWQPILGAIPPLSEQDWQIAFDKYRQIPEYHQVNKGMSLEAFKVIYWWEWSHRLLGRLIGVAFALPLAALWLTGAIRPGYGARLLGVLALGGLQGFIGWYMVQSGLVDRVDVSHYRLALHLFTAFVILALLVWLALDHAPAEHRVRLATLTRGQRWVAGLLAMLVLMQVVLGALVAGLKAGLTYNTWPLMDGRLIPEGLGTLSPWYLNLLENVTTVQFNHRMMAYALVALALIHALTLTRTADDERIVSSAWLLATAMLAQAALGIWTLLASVPISLGIAHQGMAALVLVAAVVHLHRVRRAARE